MAKSKQTSKGDTKRPFNVINISGKEKEKAEKWLENLTVK